MKLLPANIFVFGDSIALGGWDEEGGWVSRLQRELNTQMIQSGFLIDIPLTNLGVDGDDTTGVLARFKDELERRLGQEQTIIVFAIGINDSQISPKTGKFRTPPELFTQNIHDLINKARSYTDKIFFVGLTPVEDKKVDPIPWLPEMSYRDGCVQQFNNILKSVCSDERIPFFDVYPKFKKRNVSDLLIDGLHPNGKGHKIIFDMVLSHLGDISEGRWKKFN